MDLKTISPSPSNHLAISPIVRIEPLESRIAPAVFIVTSLLDDGSSGTLRSAINEANAHSGTDSIKFAPSVHGLITLSSGELSVTDDVNIIGSGASKIAISAHSASRVFNMNSADVVLNGLTVEFGSVSSNGGGIYSTGSLTVNNCVIKNCTSSSSDGGGIYDNTTGKFVLKNSLISGNTATSSGSLGGGLDVYADGNIVVANSKIIGNSAYFEAAFRIAPKSAATNITIQNCLVAANNATTTYGGGGKVTDGNYAGTHITISSTTFTGNTAATLAGGLRAEIDASSSTLSIVGSKFTNNVAGGSGGAIYASGSGTIKISASNFLSNSSGGSGGAIYTSLNLTVQSSKVSGNTAVTGGGIDATNTTTIVDSNISGNVATSNAGGLFLSTGSHATKIVSSTISNNLAGGHSGGAYFAGSGAISITSSKFMGNNASNGVGGGVNIMSTSAVIALKDNAFIGNNATSFGGGAYFGNTGTFTLSGGVFNGNNSGSEGGGIYINKDASGTIDASTTHITKNTSFSFGGGVAHFGSIGTPANGTVHLDTSKVTGNYGNNGVSAKADTYGTFVS